jgi:hypothetical protein
MRAKVRHIDKGIQIRDTVLRRMRYHQTKENPQIRALTARASIS